MTTIDPPPLPEARANLPDDERELRRIALKRIAIWGFGTGIAMLIVLVGCLALLFLASQRSG